MTGRDIAAVARRRSRDYRRLAGAFCPPPWQRAPATTREYTRLFVAPRPLVHPYESMHRESQPRVMGDSTLDVLRQYRAEGFAPAPAWRDLPDHVALELAFMAALAAREAAGWRRGCRRRARAVARAERRFMEDHLLSWLPRFCDAVLTASAETTLGRAGERLRDLLLRDHDWLCALTTEPE